MRNRLIALTLTITSVGFADAGPFRHRHCATTTTCQTSKCQTVCQNSNQNSNQIIYQAQTYTQQTTSTVCQDGACAAPTAGPIEQRLLNLHNALRAAVGRPPLVLDQSLTAYASNHSYRMAVSGGMFHSGIAGCAENVAAGQTSAEEVIGSWSRSSGHYQNIVGPYHRVGFGVVNNRWTAVFGY